MKKRLLSLTNKSLVIIVVSTVIVLLLTATGVFAAYTNSRNAQRTIAAYDASGDRFSSNDLGKGFSKDNLKTVYTTDELRSPSTVVTICNYERGKQTRPNPDNINYTLTARLVKYDALQEERYVPVTAAYLTEQGLSAFTITITKGSDSVTLGGATVQTNAFSGTLAGAETSAHAYTVTFSAGFAAQRPNLYLEMIATPSDRNLPTLSGIFRAELRLEGATNAWTGAFYDDTSSDPAEYDGFNYRITGVGKGTCILAWDTDVVALSYLSLIQLSSIVGAIVTSNSVTFAVDSDVAGLYDLQFYKVNVGAQTWTDMNTSVVTFEFHA